MNLEFREEVWRTGRVHLTLAKVQMVLEAREQVRLSMGTALVCGAI